MKPFLHITLLSFSLLAGNSALVAQTNAAEKNLGADLTEQADSHKEMRLLNDLLHMSPEELAELRQTIERIEAMPEGEREHLRSRIGHIKKMNPERLKRVRKRYESIPKEDREEMKQRWLDMTPEERRSWREKLREMPSEERHKLFKKEGFLPSPSGKRRGKGSSATTDPKSE